MNVATVNCAKIILWFQQKINKNDFGILYSSNFENSIHIYDDNEFYWKDEYSKINFFTLHQKYDFLFEKYII